MKYILSVAILLATTAALAAEPKEVYVQMDRSVQLVLSSAECKKWPPVEGLQLNYAYAVNIETGDKVDGCFSHEGDVIHVELSDEKNDLYSYKIKADNFMPRPAL
jgi:hypothetical protein